MRRCHAMPCLSSPNTCLTFLSQDGVWMAWTTEPTVRCRRTLNLRVWGLTAADWDATAGHLVATLQSLGVPDDLIGEIRPGFRRCATRLCMRDQCGATPEGTVGSRSSPWCRPCPGR